VIPISPVQLVIEDRIDEGGLQLPGFSRICLTMA